MGTVKRQKDTEKQKFVLGSWLGRNGRSPGVAGDRQSRSLDADPCRAGRRSEDMLAAFTEHPQPLDLTFDIHHTLRCVLVDCTFFQKPYSTLVCGYIFLKHLPRGSAFDSCSSSAVGRGKTFWHHGKCFA